MQASSIEAQSDYKLEGQLLDIVRYPDPILEKNSIDIVSIDQEITRLAKDMLYTMYKSPGIGLAAPQVGKNINLFVLDTQYKREKIVKADGTQSYHLSNFDPMVLINPKIVEKDGEFLNEEGCLSLPGIYEAIKRFEHISVEFLDLEGKKQLIKADGLLSICIQHEYDHLIGKVFIDHLSKFKKSFYKKRLLKEKRMNY